MVILDIPNEYGSTLVGPFANAPEAEAWVAAKAPSWTTHPITLQVAGNPRHPAIKVMHQPYPQGPPITLIVVAICEVVSPETVVQVSHRTGH